MRAPRAGLGTDRGAGRRQPAARPTSRWTPRCTSGCCAAGWRPLRRPASRARTSRRSCSSFFHRESEGVSLAANIRIILRNAALAAEIAVAARGLAVTGPARAETLEVLVVGDVMVDVIAAMSVPLARDSDTPSTVGTSGGGSAANVAAWLAAQGVPDDVRRPRRRRRARPRRGRRLADAGVDVPRVGVDPALPTGTCVVLVEPGGERSMLPDAGANDGLAPGDLPTRCSARARHLHLSGYTLLRDGSP